MGTIIGIDFGTSFCRTAVCKDGKVDLIPNRYSRGRIPFVIEYPKKDNLLEEDVKEKTLQFNFSSIKQKVGFEETILIEGSKVLVIDLASNLFSAVRDDVKGHVGEDISGAIITVPSCFAEKQRAAIRRAAKKGGFEAVRLLDESTAAVLASGVNEEGKTVLVYALGGGVFNVSLFKISNGVPQPLWHEGDRELGGNDFDTSIIAYIINRLIPHPGSRAFRPSQAFIQKLKSHAEKAKIDLSEKSTVEIKISIHEELRLTLTRSEFERIITRYIETTLSLTKKAIQRAGLTKADIDSVMLIGGSTRIPLVEKMLQEEFEKEIIRAPEELIVTGAAVYGVQFSEEINKESIQYPREEELSPLKIETEIPNKIEPPETESRGGLSEYFVNAMSFWQHGEQDKAIDTLENLLKELPIFIANLYYERGKNLLENDNIDKAILFLEKGLNYKKEDNYLQRVYHKACNKKGTILINKGNLSEAKSTLKKGLKYNPDCTGCRDLLSKIENVTKKQHYSGKRIGDRFEVRKRGKSDG